MIQSLFEETCGDAQEGIGILNKTNVFCVTPISIKREERKRMTSSSIITISQGRSSIFRQANDRMKPFSDYKKSFYSVVSSEERPTNGLGIL